MDVIVYILGVGGEGVREEGRSVEFVKVREWERFFIVWDLRKYV